MKTKIISKKGVKYLVLDEKEINDNCKFGSPITLAVISNYADSKCWTFDDYRLKEFLNPSKYLNDSSDSMINFFKQSKEDQEIILSKLYDYHLSEEEGLHYWRYDSTALNGDILDDDERRISSGIKFPRRACFSFEEAKKRLKDAEYFWNNYNGSLTDDSIRLPNKFRQPSLASFWLELESVKKRLKI